MIGGTRSQRNGIKLELEHIGEADLGQKEGLFPEQGGKKGRMAKDTYNYTPK